MENGHVLLLDMTNWRKNGVTLLTFEAKCDILYMI